MTATWQKRNRSTARWPKPAVPLYVRGALHLACESDTGRSEKRSTRIWRTSERDHLNEGEGHSLAPKNPEQAIDFILKHASW